MLGIGGSISQATVIVGIACVLLVNSVFHMFFVQIVYMILLTVGPHPPLAHLQIIRDHDRVTSLIVNF